MKRTFLILTLLLTTIMMSAATKVKVTRIDPTDWFVGLKDASLQLMVYGPGIREAKVTTDYPGVRIDSLVQLDFEVGKKTVKYPYTLKERQKAGKDHLGFSNADVLYMLMPDRFAKGETTDVPKKGKTALVLNPYKEDRSQPSLRHGGNLEGIRQHLDYFNELGVTALWFTPVLENNSPDTDNGFSTYHGYATS